MLKCGDKTHTHRASRITCERSRENFDARQVEETVRIQLGFPRLVASLTGLLEETDVQLYLAGVVILGKVSPAPRPKPYLKPVLTQIPQQ